MTLTSANPSTSPTVQYQRRSLAGLLRRYAAVSTRSGIGSSGATSCWQAYCTSQIRYSSSSPHSVGYSGTALGSMPAR